MKVHTYRMRRMIGWSALLIDDVMTSGTTLIAATEACYAGGANHVSVLALARAAKDA
jgi:predicted amidophosphoribosyltransferase